MTKVKNFKVEVTLDGEVFSTVSLTNPDGVPRNLVQYVLRGLVSEWLTKGDFGFPGAFRVAELDAPEFTRELSSPPSGGAPAAEVVPELVDQVLTERPELFELVVESSGGKLKGLATLAQLARRLNFDGDASLIPRSGVEEVPGLGTISWSKAPFKGASSWGTQTDGSLG